MVQKAQKSLGRKTLRQVPLYGALLVVLAGCGTGGAHSKSFHGTTKDGLQVTLTLNPNPPMARKQTQVSVSLAQSGVKSFQGDKVWIDESMPSMSMPKMSATLKSSDSHTFTGHTMLVMGGKWKFTVHIQKGTTEETEAFTFQVKD